MAWHPYNLDHLAQEIVLQARHRDPGSLNQAHKLRASCAYGLERFWGEHLRLKDKEPEKAAFVGDVWKALVGERATFEDLLQIDTPYAQLLDSIRACDTGGMQRTR